MYQEHWVGQYSLCGGSHHHSLRCSSRLSPPSLFPFLIFLIFWPHSTAGGILVPQPGIEPAYPALEAQSLNHWTTREISSPCLFTFGPSLLLWPLADAELLMFLRDPLWLSFLTTLLSLPRLFQPLPRISPHLCPLGPTLTGSL